MSYTEASRPHELLEEAVEDMVRIDGWSNICRYCDKAWGHEKDCWYLKVCELLGKEPETP